MSPEGSRSGTPRRAIPTLLHWMPEPGAELLTVLTHDLELPVGRNVSRISEIGFLAKEQGLSHVPLRRCHRCGTSPHSPPLPFRYSPRTPDPAEHLLSWEEGLVHTEVRLEVLGS